MERIRANQELDEALGMKETRSIVEAIPRLRDRKSAADLAFTNGAEAAKQRVIARYAAATPEEKQEYLMDLASHEVNMDNLDIVG